MPFLKLETTVALPDEKCKTLLAALSKAAAATIGKPEKYMMVSAANASMLMSGQPGDVAFVDIRSIGGLSADVNRKLSQQVCQMLHDALDIPPDRIYLNFTDTDAANWGWNGSTFG